MSTLVRSSVYTRRFHGVARARACVRRVRTRLYIYTNAGVCYVFIIPNTSDARTPVKTIQLRATRKMERNAVNSTFKHILPNKVYIYIYI